jgi:thiamine-phosphate pyrophosphorylase
VPLDGLVAACIAAEAGGATAVQLRIKDMPAGPQVRYTEALLRALSIPVYVNDRADVAWAAGAHGVHLGAEDLPPEAVRHASPPSFRIGVSVGSPAEASAVAAAAVDYWSIGSIFSTTTKPDAGEPIGVAGFRALAAGAPRGMTVIGIGGITADNAASLLEAGAHGIAVSSAVFGATDVEGAARALRRVVDGVLG